MKKIFPKIKQELDNTGQYAEKTLNVLKKPGEASWLESAGIGGLLGIAAGGVVGAVVLGAAGFFAVPAITTVIGAQALAATAGSIGIGTGLGTALGATAGLVAGIGLNLLPISKGKKIKTTITQNDGESILESDLIRDGEYGVAVATKRAPRSQEITTTVSEQTRLYNLTAGLGTFVGGLGGALTGAFMGAATGATVKMIGLTAEFASSTLSNRRHKKEQAVQKSGSDEPSVGSPYTRRRP